jgi:hypothetical protein
MVATTIVVTVGRIVAGNRASGVTVGIREAGIAVRGIAVGVTADGSGNDGAGAGVAVQLVSHSRTTANSEPVPSNFAIRGILCWMEVRNAVCIVTLP